MPWIGGNVALGQISLLVLSEFSYLNLFVMMLRIEFGLLLYCCVLAFTACGDRSQPLPPKELYSAEEMARESLRAKDFLQQYFEKKQAIEGTKPLSVETSIGANPWASNAEDQAAQKELAEWALRFLTDSLPFNALSASMQLKYRLLESQLEQQLAGWPFRQHQHPIQPLGHQQAPIRFLQKLPPFQQRGALEQYLNHLRELPLTIKALRAQLQRQSEQGILPPPFAFKAVETELEALLQGYPLTADSTQLHPIYADFLEKTKPLALNDSLKTLYRTELEDLLGSSFAEAYRGLLADWQALAPQASERHAWQAFPKGAEAYAWLLKTTTGSSLTAEEMHELGTQEVERLSAALKGLMLPLGYSGGYTGFLQQLRKANASSSRLSDSLQSQQATTFELLLQKTHKALAASFGDYPQLDSLPIDSFYRVYTNAALPPHEMQVWIHRQLLPGKYFLNNWQQSLKGLPTFQQYGAVQQTYGQAWAAYAEDWALQQGLYAKEALLGYWSSALWRAAQLVVETGLHAKGWSQEEALAYYLRHTPASAEQCRRAVERHALRPAEAAVAQIGSLHLQALRDKAAEQLGERFKVAEFHRVLLQEGPLSLDLLEDLVDNYIAEQKAI